MNIAMEQTEEYVNGQLKNKYGDAFIRGNNGNDWNHDSVVLDSHRSIFVANNWGILFLFDAVLYISTSKRTLADGA